MSTAMVRGAVETAHAQDQAGTSVAVQGKRGFGAMLAQHAERIAPFLPAGTSLERVAAELWLAAQENPDILKCTPVSLVKGVARIHGWGLQLGFTAHLLTFKNKDLPDGGPTHEATPTPDYKGYVQLFRESGVRDVDVQVVREGDVFREERGSEPRLVHEPGPFGSRGKIVGAYCILRLGPSTPPKWETMELPEIEKIRAKSRQWSPSKVPECPEWYARKSVVRRIAKYVPRPSPRLAALLEAGDDEEETPSGLPEAMPDVARLADGTTRYLDKGSPAVADANVAYGNETLPESRAVPDLPPGMDRNPYGIEDAEPVRTTPLTQAAALVVGKKQLGACTDAELADRLAWARQEPTRRAHIVEAIEMVAEARRDAADRRARPADMEDQFDDR